MQLQIEYVPISSICEYRNNTKIHTEEQISSLEGVLVPVQSNWNVDMMKKAGFRIVDQFWGYLNFAGWVAVK